MMSTPRARAALGIVMGANAALFFFGALQHVGIVLGPFHEPRIIPAAIVEGICSAALLCGVAAVGSHSGARWRVALVTNLVALAGVLLGMIALSLGAGPRTASNDTAHRIMLGLIGAGLLILFIGSPPGVLRKGRVRDAS